jgi:hypothetical protein
MWCCVIGWVVPNILKDRSAFVQSMPLGWTLGTSYTMTQHHISEDSNPQNHCEDLKTHTLIPPHFILPSKWSNCCLHVTFVCIIAEFYNCISLSQFFHDCQSREILALRFFYYPKLNIPHVSPHSLHFTSKVHSAATLCACRTFSAYQFLLHSDNVFKTSFCAGRSIKGAVDEGLFLQRFYNLLLK